MILLATLAPFGSAGGALAQGTPFTYQGRITDHGTNFNGIGLFKFALVARANTGSQAIATAIMAGSSPYEYVTGYAIVYGGSGYTTPPTVTVSGPGGSGSTAIAAAIISGGMVTAINVVSPGSGYSGPATVTIAPPSSDISYTTYWSNDGTSVKGSQPTAAVKVNVANGLFTVVLGDADVANMTAVSQSVFMQPNLQLRIWFNDGVSGFAALSPDQNLTPAPYAAFANAAENLVYPDGTPAMYGDANSNFFAGPRAGNLSLSGQWNTGFGVGTLHQDTAGSYNMAIGGDALCSNTSGEDNTAIGVQALRSNTSGGYNTAIGVQALRANTNGSWNVAIGDGALSDTASGSDNIALGAGAGCSITGNNNIDIGNCGTLSDNNIIRIGDPGIHTDTYLSGRVYASGIQLTSDQHAKEHLTPVNPTEVLAKVAGLSVTAWNYRNGQAEQHIGPTAQDFHAAFGLNGSDDTHISVGDEGGVALAAIQGLNQKLDEAMKAKDARIQSLEEQVTQLKAMMEKLTLHGNGGAQ